MDTAAHLAAIAAEAEALAVAATAAGADAPVSTCPGWTVGDLVWHTGEVFWFWADVVELPLDDPSAYQEPQRPGEDDLVGWYRTAGERLRRVLTQADPGTTVWTWLPGGREEVRSVIRRMAQEVAVHRWDAESATAGGLTPIDAELAADGIDAFFELFSGRPADDAEPLGGTAHLHCTDVDGEWLVTDDGFTREHAKGDVAVRGPASDLLQLLWRRRPLDGGGLELLGDEAVAQRLVARANLA